MSLRQRFFKVVHYFFNKRITKTAFKTIVFEIHPGHQNELQQYREKSFQNVLQIYLIHSNHQTPLYIRSTLIDIR